MGKVIRYAAFLACTIQIIVAAYAFTEVYGHEIFLALLLMAVPVLSLLALYAGPDLEERRLAKELNKARLRNELENLQGKKK